MKTRNFKWNFNTWWTGVFSFWEAFFGGHVTVGPITIYGSNAMDWTVNIRSKKYGYICFTLPFLTRWKKHKGSDKAVYTWYWYCSPDGTPNSCTFWMGNKYDEKANSILRRKLLGHNWKGEKNKEINYIINNWGNWTWVF